MLFTAASYRISIHVRNNSLKFLINLCTYHTLVKCQEELRKSQMDLQQVHVYAVCVHVHYNVLSFTYVRVLNTPCRFYVYLHVHCTL